MKQKGKKIVCLFTGILILSVLFTGCGNKTEDPVEIKRKEEIDVDTDSDQSDDIDSLSIAFYNNLINENFIKEFRKVYPDITFHVISYGGVNGSGYAQFSLENGDIPDIYVSSQNFSKECQEKYLLDLSNYDFINQYSGSVLDSLEVNGGIYLLPSGYQLTGIYYNKTILEENGWDVPTSFNELVKLSKKIEAAGYRTMGHGMSLDGYPFNYFFNIGNTIYFGTPEGTEWKEEFPKGDAKATGNDSLKETVEYFNKWVENGFITTEHMEADQFYEGECVFFLCLGISEYEYTTQDGKTYEFGTIPWLSEDGSNNMLTRTVSRYIGINKSLSDAGNEKKMDNALKFLEYISTSEGQEALLLNNSFYMPSLNDEKLPADSPYQEISYLIEEGRTVPLVYVGWEKQIVPIAQDIKKLITGEYGVDELLEAFDNTNEGLLNGSSDDIYATALERLTLEKTAELVAVAEGKAVDADCAIVSMNEYHGNYVSNREGIGWYLYQGDIDMQIINMIRTRSATISVLEMTGAEIKAMRDAGFDYNDNNNPYPYLLFTKGNIELDDASTYKLAIATGELKEDMRENATETENSPAEAIGEYLRELKVIDNETVLEWN